MNVTTTLFVLKPGKSSYELVGQFPDPDSAHYMMRCMRNMDKDAGYKFLRIDGLVTKSISAYGSCNDLVVSIS